MRRKDREFPRRSIFSRYRLGDFILQQLAVSPPQAMRRDSDSTFAHAQAFYRKIVSFAVNEIKAERLHFDN
ncbi:MAG: hypothetical protein JSW47_07820 [Phycisphaerales bacterium]|nr:MAG: hypothetical protein JSW47_07820 [Phycisphaerales bacterium]UCF14009.1 MAG: hypothetical protein JSW59_11410 [Phycisphaerales bacterium]